MRTLKLTLRLVLGVLMVFVGVLHFTKTDFFIAIMPPYLPLHRELVLLSGAIEIALGIALLIPRTAQLAGLGCIALYIAVFPANIHMAMHPELFPDISPTALYIRLPIQGVLIAWAWWCTRAKNPHASNTGA